MLRQTKEGTCRAAWDLFSLDRFDVYPVVQGFDSLRRPIRQTGADVVAYRVGHPQQCQALTVEVGKQPARAALVVAERMVHTDYRQ